MFESCRTDPATAFAMEVAEKNRELKEQSGIDLMEISSDDNYKIESEVEITKSNQYFINCENLWIIKRQPFAKRMNNVQN